jgi:hypothetical protein
LITTISLFKSKKLLNVKPLDVKPF